VFLIGILSIIIGATVGLLGGGGSILSVPILTYAVGLGPKEAIATSLLVVGSTSSFAMIQHARRGNVDWRVGGVFALTAMVGAYFGGLAASFFTGSTLLLLFAGMMFITAIGMFRGRKPTTDGTGEMGSLWLVVLEGLLVGAATGLVGAGGGFMIVPALVLLGGMDMHRAVGTSLMVMSLKSFSAFAGHISHVNIDYELAAFVSGVAVLGSFGGAWLSHRLSAKSLRKGFACFVLTMATFICWREAGPSVAAGAAAVVLPLVFWLTRKARS
jgi:uncharacterized membrane protein YfcA